MGGIGGLISGIFGSSNDDAKKVDPYQVNSNAYQYGGAPGGAQAAANLQGQRAQGSIEYGNALQGQQATEFGQSQDARAQQQDALAMARQRAQGSGLISTAITQQQQQQLAQQQSAQQASARGTAGVALAGANAAANTAQGNAQLGAQGAIAGAQEQLANQQAYAAQAAGIRGQDLGGAQGSGQLALGNQQVAQGWAGLQNNINQTQLAAQMNQQAQQSANYNAAHGIQAGAAGQNAAVNQQNGLSLIGGIVSGGSTLLGGGGGDGKARGGHVAGERPYLVGEESPELVVPKSPGFVMTALQTAKTLGAPPTAQQLASLTPEQRRMLGEMRAPARENGGQLLSRQPVGLAPGGRRAAGGPLLTRAHAANGPPPGDPNAPRMQFDPRAGWYNPSLPPARDAELDATLAADAARDAEYADQDRRIAALPPKADPERVQKFIAEDVAAAKGKNGEPSGPPNIVEIMAREQNNPRGSKVARAGASLGSSLTDAARAVDTSYHAPAAVAGPTFVALPEARARAMGGDFDTGNGVVLNKGGGLDAGASAKAMSDIATQYQRQGGSNPTSMGGGAAGALGALGGSFSNAAKGVDIGFHPVGGEFARGGYMPAREEGGLISNIATHATRALHSIASAAAEATAPEPLAVERKTPRAAEVKSPRTLAVYSNSKEGGDTTEIESPGRYPGGGIKVEPGSQMRATLIHPGPQTASNKVVKGEDDEARAKGGLMLAKGGRKRRAA